MVKKTAKGVTPGDGVFPPPSSAVRCPPRRQARSPFGLRDAAIQPGRMTPLVALPRSAGPLPAVNQVVSLHLVRRERLGHRLSWFECLPPLARLPPSLQGGLLH